MDYHVNTQKGSNLTFINPRLVRLQQSSGLSFILSLYHCIDSQNCSLVLKTHQYQYAWTSYAVCRKVIVQRVAEKASIGRKSFVQSPQYSPAHGLTRRSTGGNILMLYQLQQTDVVSFYLTVGDSIRMRVVRVFTVSSSYITFLVSRSHLWTACYNYAYVYVCILASLVRSS